MKAGTQEGAGSVDTDVPPRAVRWAEATDGVSSLRVLHLITRLDPGGSAENTLMTCQRLGELGWEVALATGPGLRDEDADVGGAPIPRLIVPNLRRDPSPVDPIALAQIYRLLRRERPEILHTHSAKAGVLGRWAGWLARVPHIVHTPHGHVLYGYARGYKNWVYLQAERLSAIVSDRLVALSEGESRESAAAGIGRADRWAVIPSGVQIERMLAAAPADPIGDGRVQVGVVARLEPVKGLDLLVRAAGLLAHRRGSGNTATAGLEVAIWGDGRERGSLEALVDAEGVSDLVRLVGTAEPVTEFLRGLQIYVQPSRNEGMGRALALAQAAGLPVVATRVCGIPDVVRDRASGLLVRPEDPAALADAIERLVDAPELRRALAAGGRAWMAEPDASGAPRFSVDAMVWHIDKLYRELLAGGGSVSR